MSDIKVRHTAQVLRCNEVLFVYNFARHNAPSLGQWWGVNTILTSFESFYL